MTNVFMMEHLAEITHVYGLSAGIADVEVISLTCHRRPVDANADDAGSCVVGLHVGSLLAVMAAGPLVL
jgi:hypothetical protein